ncbi:MAG: nucleotidyl transferase AbiEii/AbiGii toxin family protein [Pseudomonadota bacterium]
MGALGRALADLDALGSRVALVGGLAIAVRADPRFTRDVDLAVSVADDAGAEAVVRGMLHRGYGLLGTVEQDVTGRLATVRLAMPGQGEHGVVLDLLFATVGIEREIVAEASEVELVPGLSLRVARVGHLLAMKLLARDEHRPLDQADIDALMGVADEQEILRLRAAAGLITTRGCDRGRDLGAAMEALLSER